MKDIASMSRAELVRQLVGSSRRADTRTTTPHPEAHEPRPSETREPRVSYKLAVARELLLRDLAEQMKSQPVLSSPAAVRDWLRLYCAPLGHEVFLVLLLDAQHRLLEARELFRGTLTQTSVYPREVVKLALQANAAAVLLAHNHPSGAAEPSRADEILTQNLKSSLALVEVRVLDHFVVAGVSALSFSERGLI